MLASSIVLPSIQVASLHPDSEQEPLNPSTSDRTNNIAPRDSKPSTRDYSVLSISLGIIQQRWLGERLRPQHNTLVFLPSQRLGSG